MEETRCRAILAGGLVATLAAVLASGCYLSHGRGDGMDGGNPPDGTVVRPDGSVPPDGGVDSGRDAGPDAGPDGGMGPDAEPPVGPPPNPERCRIEPEVFPFTDPVQEARWPDGPMAHPESVHVCSTPVVIDLDPTDGLDDPVVIFPSYATLSGEERGVLRIWNPRTHTTISYPPMDGELGVLEATGNVAAGDIDGDGRNEIVAMGIHAGTYAFRHDGSLMWESPFPTARDRGLLWARTIGTAITLADLEGDGTVEVIAGRNVLEGIDGTRRFVGDSETTTRGTNQFLGPIACVADLDGDGSQEVIAGRTVFRANGDIFWNQTSLGDGLCAVADVVPSNPGPEVVLSSVGYFYVLDGLDGDILYSRPLEGRGTEGVGGAPTVADFDGDGRPEIGIAHGTAYGVYDLECMGRGRPAGCAAQGLLWSVRTGDDSSSGTGSSVFDFNGDGRAEVVYNDQYYFRVYDGATGTTLFQEPNSSRTRTENPVIVDVDNDGDAEIVFSANAEAFFIRDFWTDPGVEIWGDRRGRWVGARRIWNQHAYHITNVEEDGTIASPEVPSWTVLNAYRQNLREGADVLVVPDLWGGRGSYECLGDGRVRFVVNVQNWGLERVGAGVLVGFYRGRPRAGGVRIGEVRTTRPLEPRGDGEVVTFETTLTDEVVDYYAVLDDRSDLEGGAVAECLENNNEVLIWRPFCGGE
ncbi:MAG TPA: FG-GAP-like repeat-containing protein [Sandaracinaceae bacterium]